MNIDIVNINLEELGIDSKCNVYCINIQMSDIDDRAKEMIDIISDMSWISKLESIPKATFKARAKRTVSKLVKLILDKDENEITEEFGEFLVSSSAQEALSTQYGHTIIPLAELLKEKVTGNPGFDFHTESHSKYIVFGEAKYSRKNTPRAKAITQINEFVSLKKDNAEFIVLEHFVSEEAMENALVDKKSYAAAFSINNDNIQLTFNNAIKSDEFINLLDFPELYLIGIQI